MRLLDELIDQHGRGTLITVSPYTPDSSNTVLRWVVSLDGSTDHDLDVCVEPDANDPRWTGATLVRGSESVDLQRFRGEPALLSDTLGLLRDRIARREQR